MPKSCQLVLFSATFPDVVREFAGRLARRAPEHRQRERRQEAREPEDPDIGRRGGQRVRTGEDH